MSAYICSPDHLLTLAGFAATNRSGSARVNTYGLFKPVGKPGTLELAEELADVLYQENVRSVLARYPRCSLQDAPGPNVKPDTLIGMGGPHHMLAWRDLGPVALLKMCQCVDYQSCETEDWPQTTARELLLRIQNAAVKELPGYDDAPWSIGVWE